jgi:uncharacterized membrane protein YhaH (DUF805 family)
MLQALFGFHGRMRRATYWAIGLALGLGLTPVMTILGWLVFPLDAPTHTTLTPFQIGYLALLVVVSFLALWIRLAIQVKRWHDLDRSGWWTLGVLFPVIGAVWVLVECGFFDGTRGPNRYGASPKGHGVLEAPSSTA